MTETEHGVLFIVSSPSGGGKTTLIRETIARLAGEDIEGHFSISHTTRAARPAETDGVDYHFVETAVFEEMAQRGDFLEWAEYADHLYGTSRQSVEEQLTAGHDVFLDIEVQGANQVKTQIPEVVKIFVYPPSFEVLEERLRDRRQDSSDEEARPTVHVEFHPGRSRPRVREAAAQRSSDPRGSRPAPLWRFGRDFGRLSGTDDSEEDQ